MAESQTTGTALYYTDPQPVTLEAHRHWRLKDGNVAFTKDSLGVPVVIGAKGVERIVEIQLNGQERAMFEKSAQAVATLVDACKSIAPNLGKGV